MAKSDDVNEIEVYVKSLLNMGPCSGSKPVEETEVHKEIPSTRGAGIVFTKKDLEGVSYKKQEPVEQQEGKKKKKKPKQKDKTHVEDVATADGAQHLHHQADPGVTTGVLTDGKQVSKKKKKKKPKKTKTDKEGVDKNNEGNNSNSDNSDIENEQLPSKPVNLVLELKTKYLDDQLTPAILHELETEKIFPLKKKSVKFQFAKYFCRLCDYHCDNIPVCRQHANDARHRRRKEIMIQDKKIKDLPNPSERHMTSLDKMVEDIYNKHGLSDDDLAQRQAIAARLQTFITKAIPDADLSVRLYGSSLTGFGLKSSDVNMDLVQIDGSNPTKGLLLVHKALKESELFKNVQSDFQAKVPGVLFQPVTEDLKCQITVGCDSAFYTSLYLKMYTKLDDRVRKLGVAFKYWAKICQVDDQESGSLPAYTFGLMTVYYLQQCKPHILPALGKDLTFTRLKQLKTDAEVLEMFEDLLKEPWSTSNEETVGSLWRNILLFYGVYFDLAEFIICVRSDQPLRRAEKKWKSRRVAIEDPFFTKRNVARSLHNTRVFEYFYNCLRKACLYFSLPTTHQNLAQFYNSKRKTTLSQKESEKVCSSYVAKNINIGRESQKNSDFKFDFKDSESETIQGDLKGNLQNVLTASVETELTSSAELSSDVSIRENKFLEDCRDGLVIMSELEESFNKQSMDDVENSESAIAESALVDAESEESETVQTETVQENTKNCTCESAQEMGDTKGSRTSLNLCPACDKLRNETNSVELPNSDLCEALGNDIGADTSKCDTDMVEDGVLKNKKILTYSSETLRKINETTNIPFDVQSLKWTPLNVLLKEASENKLKCEENEQIKDKKKEEKVVGIQVDDDTIEAESEISESETDSGSGSDSDVELESPDTTPVKSRKRVSSPVGAEYDYVFTTDTLTDGKGPSIFCQICEKEGHLKMSCPDDKLPSVIELPPPTKQHLQHLTFAIIQVPKDFQPTNKQVEERERILRNIENHIQETFEEAELCLFGSSKNGFGFRQSDLDICVTFRGKKPEDINFVEYIEAICKKLKTHRGLYNVFPITTAKVPIVKFKHRTSQLEGDISLYNILAQHNTCLLATYASIDPRVVILGFAIKVFAKVCDIGDASKGSLSSYAYMLMMLHYLQHTSPPIIPVLQEIRSPDNPNPKLVIEGCNAWFYDDRDSLPQVWPDFGKNQQSVGELWLGFFRYYIEEFNILEQVVTIRQFDSLTKFEKLWNGKCIAIEDPFDLNHNLGGGLSRKMNQYILRSLLHARELYGMSISDLPKGFQSLLDYFFDKEKLTEGDPPSDRLCRVCSKIGHIARECPRVLARKERDAKDKKRREDNRMAQTASPGNKNQNRPTSGRSLSDPADHSSPSRGPQRYQQQHSNAQSPDKRRMKGMLPMQDNYPRGNFHPSSPQHIPVQNFSHDRQTQSHSPNGYALMNQPGQRQSPRNNNNMSNNIKPQFNRANQNENSGRRYNYGNRNKNMPQYSSNQNMDYREGAQMHKFEGPREYSANSNREFPSSANQNRSYISRNHPEGTGQVLVDLNKSYAGGGVQNAFSHHAGLIPTNPALIIPSNIIPPAAVYLSTTNMCQPISACSETSQLNNPRNVNSRSPVCSTQGWFPVQTRQSLQAGLQLRTTLQVGAEMSDRQVNLQKGSRAMPDVGVTVTNEYYRERKQ